MITTTANVIETKGNAGSAAMRPYLFLSALVAGYIGVYLCRKNLSVAVPILQKEWGLSKESIGIVASVSTVAYACGKLIFGPVVDRMGGRNSFLASMLLVAFFGAMGAFAPSMGFLTLCYSANRFAGSASWGAMVKQTPEWFGKNQLAFAIGVLSLSFVFGGAVAVYIAGLIAQYSQDNWHAIMGMPSAILLLLICFCWYVLPPGEVEASSRRTQRASKPAANFRLLFFDPQFYIICALSFVLTFLRETFNFWTVDFVKTEGGKMVSNSSAAFFSTPFDVMGGLGIVLLGWIYSRIGYRARTRLLFASLSLLSGILFVTPEFFHYGLWAVTLSVGLIGFLVYGPYSLLAGVLSVEVRGKEYAATQGQFMKGFSERGVC